MQVNISGQHVDTGAALKEYVTEALEDKIKKYFENAVSADVKLSKRRHLFLCNIFVNEGTGNHVDVQANGEDEDVHQAFSKALEKIEKQLRRYKNKIKGFHKIRTNKEAENLENLSVTQYVLSSEEDKEEFQEGDAPVIIAEQANDIEKISVSDAVMRMDLGDLPALVFINSKNNSVNVIYRRQDGHISWIDSGIATK